MSLSSLLLSHHGGEAEKIDTELDAIFQSTRPATLVPVNPAKKRKTREEGSAGGPSDVIAKVSHVAKNKRARYSKDAEGGTDPHRNQDSNRLKVSSGNEKGKETKGLRSEVQASESSEDSDQEQAAIESQTSSSEEDLVHESLSGPKKKTSGRSKTKTKTKKYVPESETPAERDLRTIFVGNLSMQVAQQRPLLKQLHRHILSAIPSAKIESTRFRSVPFQVPTSKLPTSDDQNSPSKQPTTINEPSSAPSRHSRPHDRERISAWRERQTGDGNKDLEGGKSDGKIYLKPNQKKRIAFINQEFHSSADTVNAYIVFAYPPPPQSRPSNLPPLPPVMDPYQAALSAVESCNGTLFMDRRLRVDSVAKDRHGGDKPKVEGDNPKLSIFVGNLDFASKEEDLRVFFEGIVSAERGPPPDEEEGAEQQGTWVTRVRIVRDKDTQLGKGFAYVQFADRECVDEVLAQDESKLKFAKRRLRVQRCKTITMAPLKSRSHPTSIKPSARPSAPSVVSVPKGDPALGEKLAFMTKEDRKKLKASDADRVARRLAKKKARIALEKSKNAKVRERIRKTPSQKKTVRSKKESKPRVRSEKSMSVRNKKK